MYTCVCVRALVRFTLKPVMVTPNPAHELAHVLKVLDLSSRFVVCAFQVGRKCMAVVVAEPG